MKFRDMPRPPREYFEENVLLTFQDDPVAFKTMDMMDPRQLMWANDFPHADSTWPWSHALLLEQTKGLSEAHLQMILHDNVKELYKLDVD